MIKCLYKGMSKNSTNFDIAKRIAIRYFRTYKVVLAGGYEFCVYLRIASIGVRKFR